MDGSRTTEENLVGNTDGNRPREKPKDGVDIDGDHIEEATGKLLQTTGWK